MAYSVVRNRSHFLLFQRLDEFLYKVSWFFTDAPHSHRKEKINAGQPAPKRLSVREYVEICGLFRG
jgi:hypothetical protein